MKEIAISQFKAKCLRLVKEVSKTKQPIRITRFGKPVAEVVPPSPEKRREKFFGSMVGRMEILGDIVSPVVDLNDFEVFQDEAAPRHTYLDLEHEGSRARRRARATRTEKPNQ